MIISLIRVKDLESCFLKMVPYRGLIKRWEDKYEYPDIRNKEECGYTEG